MDTLLSLLALSSYSWPDLTAVALAVVVILLTIGGLIFSRLVTKGLTIIDAFPSLVATVEALKVAIEKMVANFPPGEFFDRVRGSFTIVESHTKVIDRHDIYIADLTKRQENDHRRLEEVEKHREFVHQKLEDIDDGIRKLEGGQGSLMARLILVERSMAWDGKTERRRRMP